MMKQMRCRGSARFRFCRFCKHRVCIYPKIQTGQAEAAVHRYMYQMRNNSLN